jgi:hypothetical protein
MEALQSEPEVLMREGLIFRLAASTKVIPDRLTKVLAGFVGGRHLTIEYDYTCSGHASCSTASISATARSSRRTASQFGNVVGEDFDESGDRITEPRRRPRARVEALRQAVGLVYYVADGYHKFLRRRRPRRVRRDLLAGLRADVQRSGERRRVVPAV